MMANSLAKILIMNLLNGIPAKHDVVIVCVVFLLFGYKFDKYALVSHICICIIASSKLQSVSSICKCCVTNDSLFISTDFNNLLYYLYISEHVSVNCQL